MQLGGHRVAVSYRIEALCHMLGVAPVPRMAGARGPWANKVAMPQHASPTGPSATLLLCGDALAPVSMLEQAHDQAHGHGLAGIATQVQPDDSLEAWC